MLESANRSRDPEVSSKDATIAKVNTSQSEDLTKSATNTLKRGRSNSAAEKSSLVQISSVDQVEEDFEEAVEDNAEEEEHIVDANGEDGWSKFCAKSQRSRSEEPNAEGTTLRKDASQ